MKRRDFFKAIGVTGIAGTVLSADGADLNFVVPKEIKRKRTLTFRVVILFESKPGGKYSSCLNALGAAGLERERRELILHPNDFLITRIAGEIRRFPDETQSHIYELRRFF